MIRLLATGLFSFLASITALCQTDFAQEVQRRLTAYYENEAGPKAYLTFNQPEYSPGDTAFFKAHLLAPSGNALMKGWQVIDIFVIDQNDNLVLRNRTSIKNGTGASQFFIPADIKEGRYTLMVAQPDLSKATRQPIAFTSTLMISGKNVPTSDIPKAVDVAAHLGEKRVSVSVTEQKETSSLNVVLHSNNTANIPQLHFVCTSRHELIESVPIKFDHNGTATLTLSMNLLPAGLNRFSAMDEDGNVFSDQLFYKARPWQPTTDTLGTYATREPIEFEIAIPKELSARLINGSVSVYKKDLFTEQPRKSLADAITFSDVNGSPTFTSSEEQSINGLLPDATATVDWKNIWSSKTQFAKPVYSSFFKGKIILPTGNPKDSTLITFWFKNQDFIYHVYASSQGQYSFPLFTEFSDDEILYTVSYKNTSLPEARIVVENVSIQSVKNTPITYSSKENPYAWFSTLRHEIQKSYGYFQRDESVAMVRPYVESIPTDATFPVEKFKDFANVAEMVNEVISVAKAKKVGNRYELRVFLREFAMHASGNPLVVIDGIVTDSIDYLMNMRPSEIKSLGVVNSRNKLVRYGALGRNGIITVETNRTTIQELQSQKSIFVKGIDAPIEFSAGVKTRENERTPRLRATLFWDPVVTLTKTSPYVGQFQTSDDVGEYVILFEGIDEKGNPVEIKKSFKVKYQPLH